MDDAGVDHDPVADLDFRHAVAQGRDHAGAVRTEDPRLRNRRESLPNPDVEMVEAGGSELDERLARTRLGIGDVLVAEDVRPSVLVDANGFHGQNPRMTAAALSRLAADLGLDVVGAAPAEAYEETEQHIRERKAEGLFADMRFTMARPEVSCHPERLLEGACTVVSAALCYYEPSPEPAPGEGRLARYTWRDSYADLRTALDELGRRLGGRYRVFVDSNEHVDREAAVRAGVAFYGKNTMAITRRFGSWVVLGTLVTDVEIESTPALELDCGSCRLCIDACPTGALDTAGELDANKCLSYWTQAPAPTPEEYRAELHDMVYGCDICQDVCPWNRGIEKRRGGSRASEDATPAVSLRDWLERDGQVLVDELDRLYVPRNDPRWLRRNALVAAGNAGPPELVPAVERFVDDDDPVLSEAAGWALSRMSERSAPA